MGVFVNYSSNSFSNLINIPTTILTTDNVTIPHTVIVNGIMICNKGNQTIRIYLQKQISGVTDPIFYAYEVELKAYETVDLVTKLGVQIFLNFTSSPLITNQLICYSNNAIQKFDCEITYTVLNETPVTL